jgi:SpoVK/Ycf46/Vps4 family AAA+-type ATPase
MVFVGPPGTGKSLAAKAVSSVLGVPLIRLDFGKVFNSLVGKSEERIRVALRMVESMAPCVLFVDEIDKGLGGIGGAGDSGTSSRVLGTFLTWLNDCESPVFTMVTANNITGLPPELMRRGRFDAIFATGLPTPDERMTVLNIHLEKRGWDATSFERKDKMEVINVSRGYVPAEIESAVKDGLIDAFDAGEDFTMGHVVSALKTMTPLSQSYAEAIQLMTAWAKSNAIPASRHYEDAGTDTTNVESLGSRKTRVRTKKNEDD